MTVWLEFEKPVLELEEKIQELRASAAERGLDAGEELGELERKAEAMRREIYANLTRYQRVQIARHPKRPYFLDYVERCFTGFRELHGDRHFADDPAIVGGPAWFEDRPVMLIGQQKGRDTKENLYRRFGMPSPEGYRKALRLMQLADRFHVPIVTLVDTSGAYPGLGAEERGQAEAIAFNLREMSALRTPIIVTVTGEGGSGGALAIAVGDRVNMLEHAVYSVISPEGCASILFRDASRASEAALAMKITAPDLAGLGLVDAVIPEPPGGAHVNHEALFRAMDEVLWRQLEELRKQDADRLPETRYRKFREMGRLGREFKEAEP